MNDDSMRMMELGMQGYGCSQILLLLALEAQKKENPDLVRAMGGLLAGMGSGKVCGALTGGCCLLGLFAGKGTPESSADERLAGMLERFVEWFEVEYTGRYGSVDCAEILANDPRNKLTRCPGIVAESLLQLKEILKDNGYTFEGQAPPA
jgi:C_GCAxxG_C_C family probable redox protein